MITDQTIRLTEIKDDSFRHLAGGMSKGNHASLNLGASRFTSLCGRVRDTKLGRENEYSPHTLGDPELLNTIKHTADDRKICPDCIQKLEEMTEVFMKEHPAE